MSENNAVEFVKDIPQGLTVYWFPNASVDKEPILGIVTGVNDTGSVELQVIQKNGSSFVVHACYHKSQVEDFKTASGGKTGAIRRNGCWDFSPFSKMLYDWYCGAGDCKESDDKEPKPQGRSKRTRT